MCPAKSFVDAFGMAFPKSTCASGKKREVYWRTYVCYVGCLKEELPNFYEVFNAKVLRYI